MKLCLIAVLALVASWAILLSPHAAVADPPKEAELLKRIEQLEKRVADLEKAIKERPSVKEPATAAEKNLIGSWTITADSKKTAIAKKAKLRAKSSEMIWTGHWTDLNLKADGTCDLVMRGEVYKKGSYKVTVVGSIKSLFIKWVPLYFGAEVTQPRAPIQGYEWDVRIASVSEEELVLWLLGTAEPQPGLPPKAEVVKLRYIRAK
jgi:hypothetical protein